MHSLSKFTLFSIILSFLLVIFIGQSTVIINAGQSGVVYKTFGGGVDIKNPPLSEGLHIIAPWNKVSIYEVRQQELFDKMKVLSSNGLDITLDASAWYQPKLSYLGLLHKTKGPNYLNSIIKPSVRSATRSVIGRYNPEEIYSTKRDAIQQEIFDETKKILSDQYIQLNEILVRDVTLPSTIKTAIERKLKQEQESLEYEFRLTKAQKEADRQRIQAQGKADANDILSASISDNILKDKGIEATLELSRSNNSKVVIIGGKDGLPIILGNN
ncbi:MAG: prohibitin family protein [Bacteroides sp.]|nr:MAG: prohibitin family protein [Bacteroides sp.]